MKSFALTMLALAALTCVGAGKHPVEFFDPDVQRLIKVEYFAFGGVGYAGRTSEGESAFTSIIRKKEAIRFILAAFDFGTPAARYYALVALREESPKLFADCLVSFRAHPPKEIFTMNGCIVERESPATLLEAIEAGRFSAFVLAAEKNG